MADPRNFDEFYNGNRAFIIGGQTFHWRPIHWREWGELIDRRVADELREEEEREKKIQALVKKDKNLSREQAEVIVDDEGTVIESLESVIERTVIYLEPNEIESFKSTMNDRTKGISTAMLNDLLNWLQECQTPERPTQPPLVSSPGPGTPGAISPAA